MKNRLMKKCRSRSGETIAETLVALLISALALTMLAGSITTATKVTKRGEDEMMAYYAATNQVLSGEASTPGNVCVYSGANNTVDLLNGIAGGVLVAYSVYTEMGAVPVGAYTYAGG